jgi:two-component system, NtrC family, sensor kinase
MTAESNAANLALSSPNLQQFLAYLPQLKQNAGRLGHVLYQADGRVVDRAGITESVAFQPTQPPVPYLQSDWRYVVPIQVRVEGIDYQLALVYDAKIVLQDLIAFSIRILALVLVISLSLTLFMVWIVNRQLIRPILWLQSDVQRSAQAIEQAQSFEDFASLQYAGQNELQEVIQAFHHSHHQIVGAIDELRLAQAQLVHTEKMSSLGQLGAGFAHEVNNPINFISANLQHVNQYSQDLLGLISRYQSELPAPSVGLQQALDNADLDFLKSDMPNLVQSMQSGADRIQNLVLSFRNFVRLDEAERKLANLHEGMDSTLLLLQNKLSATAKRPEITIEKIYNPIPNIRCCPAQLNQVFMYLLTNAIEAIDRTSENPQPRITISTDAEPDQIRISITDNGCGIPDAIRSKIFDPFFTTKDVGQGMGLGLTNSYKIIHDTHQGTLVVAEATDCTTFTITLPHSLVSV